MDALYNLLCSLHPCVVPSIPLLLLFLLPREQPCGELLRTPLLLLRPLPPILPPRHLRWLNTGGLRGERATVVRQDEEREGETLFGKGRKRGQNGQSEPVQTVKKGKRKELLPLRWRQLADGRGKRIRGAKVQMGFLPTRAKEEENM